MLSKEIFRNPPASYRPLPFWFWNGRLDPLRIEAQIRDFHQKGLGGFFIHARFGLETEYLGEEWFRLSRRAVEIARELEMEVWLYDENGFPSGIGDLKISRVPEYRPRFVEAAEYSGLAPHRLPEGEPLSAIVWDRSTGEITDVCELIWDGVLNWSAEGPKGQQRATVFVKRTLEAPNDVIYGVNYLNAEAMSSFFEFALEPCARELGEHFGETIKGIFTDEPTLLPWHHGAGWYGHLKHPRVVVWDDRIAEEMQSRHSLQLQDWLPHLFYTVNQSTPLRRVQFWSTVSDLYVKAFFEPYRRWCDAHNLKFTGHVLFEEGLYLNTDFQADITRNLEHFHIPGTDHLGAVTEVEYGGRSNTPKMLTNVQGEKLAVSLARIQGSEAVLSETFGCAGWNLSLQQMKWITDWQYALGINLLCPHAVFYSIEGFRKYDAPPSQNHMTTWRHYRWFADYVGRLSYVLRQGRPATTVAVLYPLSSFWAVHTVGRDSIEQRTMSDSFDLICSVLAQMQVEYDILPEGYLDEECVSSGVLFAGERKYDTLILPLLPYASSKVLAAVEAFQRSGGTAIAHSPPGLSPGPLAELLSYLPERSIIDISPRRAEILAALLRALPGRRAGTVEISGSCASRIRFTGRDCGGVDIYFMANESAQDCPVDIWLGSDGPAEVWDAETGEVSELRTRPAAGGSEFSHRFPPFGSLIVAVDTTSVRNQGLPEISSAERIQVIDLPDRWEFSIVQENGLILNSWSLKMTADGAGTVYAYRTVFSAESDRMDVSLLLDDIEYRSSLMGGMDLTITVNGDERPKPRSWDELDPGFKVVDISDSVRKGRNEIVITIRHQAWAGQPHVLNSMPRLIGHFRVKAGNIPSIGAPRRLVKAGSWTDYGYPFYSGTAIYRGEFMLPADIDGKKVVLKVEDLADMLEIDVNGQLPVTRPWQPWEADITRWAKPGKNDLAIKITNSMQNFLEGVPVPSGLLGKVYVELYER